MGLTMALMGAESRTNYLANLDVGSLDSERFISSVNGGWLFLNVTGVLAPQRLESSLAASVKGDGLSLGAYVSDSDFAFVFGLRSSQAGWWLVFNEDAAYEFSEGRWALDRAVQVAGSTSWQEAVAAKVSNWSREAPRSVEKQRVLELLRTPWEFAEDAIHLLLREMNLDLKQGLDLRHFQGLTNILSFGTQEVGGRELRGAQSRFILGEGQDFLGIWDRQAPERPVQTFPKSHSGGRQAWERWRMLTSSGFADPEGELPDA